MDKKPSKKKVAIIGGGVAGSTIAMYLSKFDIEIDLFEQGTSLVNGPPICHLHAGGNLYREISDEQCIALLTESIQTAQFFPHSLNIRPTIIAVPKDDRAEASDLLPRLNLLQKHYQKLIEQSKKNEVFGRPEDYFTTFTKQELFEIAKLEPTSQPRSMTEWMIPFAKTTDLEQIKYPVVIVQEYGLSVFRMASTAQLVLSEQSNVNLHLSCRVEKLNKQDNGNWFLSFTISDTVTNCNFDYVINCAGFRTGIIDDLAQQQTKRLVEFKAAYVTHWNSDFFGKWPEVIFHGERGTPKGMAQLTPYPNGYFQLHGMTEEITLFKDGLSRSSELSSQPQLPEKFINKITNGWKESIQQERTEKAIKHLSQFIASFETASTAGKPLYGAQQIPGDDITLRAATINYDGHGYFRAEIVKASSAIECAKQIAQKIKLSTELNTLTQPSNDDVCHLAEQFAIERGYPVELAQTY
ncbi:FAD-dependent oxidoreductase [Aliivibrio fischeri]|uniref:FAD-dependent oxidoreductase n=1 Tax=Aliivibrio fischeri TaxID=668 RepID=UPI001F1E96A0|nr:FAD-dependent oxidoreductase [Aliivibrio fischeri]MCE7535578.1 FAD-dependent oxidoreductase [Aliivibrio fischeri]MCE7559256.1 FAD-dependent oxidoreductase [Aliivibrio fischeri]